MDVFLSSIKEINRLISKRMSNIYLKVTTEKNWRFQNLGSKNSSPGDFLGTSNSSRYNWILQIVVAFLKSENWEQKRDWLFCCFNFERNYAFCWTKSWTLHKKWRFPLRISSVNMTKSAISCGFGHIHWKNP